MKHKMVVIEDDQSIREMLSYYFKAVDFEVRTFECGEDYFEQMPGYAPSVLILDIMLPGIDGFEILERIRKDEKTADVPVILLTALGAEADRVRGFISGGDDYVVKPFSIKELEARVGAILRRSAKEKEKEKAETEKSGAGEMTAPHEAEVISYEKLTLDLKAHEARLDGKLVDLTNKEFDLMCMLIKNKSRVVSRNEILSDVWGYEYAGKTRTVDMHVRSIRSKLGEDLKNPKYIVTVHGIGYKVV